MSLHVGGCYKLEIELYITKPGGSYMCMNDRMFCFSKPSGYNDSMRDTVSRPSCWRGWSVDLLNALAIGFTIWLSQILLESVIVSPTSMQQNT